MVSIHVVGHVCVDLTPTLHTDHFAIPGELTEVGALDIRTGGTVSNCARAVQSLGAHVRLSGRVGDDHLGRICHSLLNAEHPGQVELIIDPQAATSYSVVIHPPSLDRSFLHHTGANDFFDGTCELHPDTLLHFGYPTLCPTMCADNGQPIVDLFTRVHEAGGATSLDLAYLAQNSPLQALDWGALFDQVLPHTDVFCPSWDDLSSCLPGTPADPSMGDVEAIAQRFIDAGAGLMLITLGKDGAFLRAGSAAACGALEALCGIDTRAWEQVSVYQGAVDLTAADSADLDTNGAGDTFKAAFLVALTRAASTRDALVFASEVVTRKLLRLPLMPTAAEEH